MGKRSTTSTKSGRAVNPADQARKEARKRELKKNKKQRQVVREAVIKAKDPKKVIEELERLDQMEYNVTESPPLPDHVLLERRKRLLGNFNRCLSLYDKEDKAMYAELKRMLSAYHRKHEDVKKYYESVRKAQSVSVDSIPLPTALADDESGVHSEEPGSTSKPHGQTTHSGVRTLSWEMFSDDLSDVGGKRPPGPPCCPPPSLSDDSDDEEILEKPEVADSNEESDTDLEVRDDRDDIMRRNASEKFPAEVNEDEMDQSIIGVHSDVPAFPPARIPGHAMFAQRSPNFRNVPPPRLPPHRFGSARPGPPGMPPGSMIMRPPQRPPFLGTIGPIMRPVSAENLAYRPTLTNLSLAGEPKATIEARPQLRNMMAEVTRLIPTAVKVKREEHIKPKPKPATYAPSIELIPHRPAISGQQSKGGADQAYDEFMKEMEGLL